jgi:hypothetical protein
MCMTPALRQQRTAQSTPEWLLLHAHSKQAVLELRVRSAIDLRKVSLLCRHLSSAVSCDYMRTFMHATTAALEALHKQQTH